LLVGGCLLWSKQLIAGNLKSPLLATGIVKITVGRYFRFPHKNSLMGYQAYLNQFRQVKSVLSFQPRLMINKV
jgi:hypothetical protein